jgi:hypothetical protein
MNFGSQYNCHSNIGCAGLNKLRRGAIGVGFLNLASTKNIAAVSSTQAILSCPRIRPILVVAIHLSMEHHGWKQTGKKSPIWAFEHR